MKYFLYKFYASIMITGIFSHFAIALSCGDIITSSITLTDDLHCTTGYYALEVRNDNVTINLNGHRIFGSDDLQGIIVSDMNKVRILGPGSISGFWAGINSTETFRLQVRDITFFDVGSGVILSAGNKAYIAGNDFINTSSQAVHVNNRVLGNTAGDNVITNNEFYKARVGIEICGFGSSNNTINGNLIWKSADYGIHLTNSTHNQIYDNTILETTNTALRMNNATFNKITGNSLRVGRVGLSLISQTDSACLANPVNENTNNEFSSNHAFNFDTGIVIGLGINSKPMVYDNQINGNKIYDDSLGIFFNTDAYNNDARFNAYTGTTTPTLDLGTGNFY